MLADKFTVSSPNVRRTDAALEVEYTYNHNEIELGPKGEWVVRPQQTRYHLATDTRVPKLG